MFNRIRSIRKRWLVVAATVALLAVGLASGAVFAASGPGDSAINGLRYGHDYDRSGNHLRNGGKADVMARVAEIIGVERETLEAAFRTARNEQGDARFAARADALVADATITQEQADDAVAWFVSRPDYTGKLAHLAARSADSAKMATLLERLVTKDHLTQEQADAIAAWHDERPDFLPEISATRSRFHGDFDGGKRGFRGHR